MSRKKLLKQITPQLKEERQKLYWETKIRKEISLVIRLYNERHKRQLPLCVENLVTRWSWSDIEIDRPTFWQSDYTYGADCALIYQTVKDQFKRYLRKNR